jgi:hypothetical protein
MRNTKADTVDKMQIYFCYTRYQATYITRLAATDISKINALHLIPFVQITIVFYFHGAVHCFDTYVNEKGCFRVPF